MMSEEKLSASIISDKIEIAFSRLIGPLTIMSKLKSYESSQTEINDLLNIVTNWGVKFQDVRNLFFLSPEELINVYNRLNALTDKYLYDPNLGLESELSDEIVIWMYELMELRKMQIEGNKNE